MRTDSAEHVRAIIARAVLGDEVAATRVGSVTLHAHQRDAVARVREMMQRFGGALLADSTGLGKTHVALVLMKEVPRALVVAPAVLREMWRVELTRAGCEGGFVSFEALSRGSRPNGAFDLVVVDEAHHARNAATRRYAELAALTSGARVLLLSATPVHNRRRDLEALLALFLGARARSLDDVTLASHIVRRTAQQIPATSAMMPMITRHAPITFAADGRVAGLLAVVPPPLRASDEGDAGALIPLLLHRLWSSSDAALRNGIRRRLARASAMRDLVSQGTLPSNADLALWSFDGDAMQLAFPEIIASPPAAGDLHETAAALDRHLAALEILLRALPRDSVHDRARARALVDIRRAHPGKRIVAFSAFASTVSAMGKLLSREDGVCALTAAGAHVAGGELARAEALARFAPRAHGRAEPRRAERIDLLLSTDLLSEGVNLQDASVVVHLDLPWTAARLQQRVGRAARLGAVAAEVHEYTFAPHAMAERVLQLDQRLRTKLGIAASAVSPVECDELLRAELRGWRRDIAVPDEPAIAAVCASTRGALAILRIDGTARMLGAMDCQQLSDSPALLLEIVRMCHGRAGAVDRASREWLDGVVAQWRRTHSASEILAAHELPFGETRLKALHRVSQLLRDAPPHRRPVLESLAIAARRSLLAPAGVGVEQDIARLTDSNLDPEPLFRAIAAVGARVSCARKRESAVELVAAIILRDC